MTKYLLDTNIISYLGQPSSPFFESVKNSLSLLADEDEVYISVFSLYEIEFGIATSKSHDIKMLLSKIKETAQEYFQIMPFTEKGVEIFGLLQSEYLNKTGITKNAIKKHNLDFMIASLVITENTTLISNDKIFLTIKEIYPEFTLENWI